jgi:hypothetical protein
MNKIMLQNDFHIFQMLGVFDGGHGYAMPKDIAEILIKMPKRPIINSDEIDVGTGVAFLQSTGEPAVEFCIQENTLFLVERATEMGGIVAYTYLVPLVDITPEYFTELDANIDLAPLKARIQNRRAKYLEILARHEHLARKAIKQLAPPDVTEYKRYIRRGKPDFNCAQLQYFEHVNGTNEVIERWKAACNNITAAKLVPEIAPELHIAQIKESKKKSGGKGRSFDFKSLLYALSKEKPKKQPARIKSNPQAAQLLDDTEIEGNFEPELIKETEEIQAEKTDTETKQIVTDLLSRKDKQAVALMLKTSFQSKTQVEKSRRAPASSNPDREQ